MLELLAALSIGLTGADSVGSEARCELDANGNFWRVRSVTAQCEALEDTQESQALQAAADALLARVAFPISARVASVPSHITLHRFEEGWDLEATAQLSAVDYELAPHRRRGLLYTDCAGIALINADSTVSRSEWACVAQGWDEPAEPHSDNAMRLRNQMEDGRWLLPLRFDQGCAEASVLNQHGYPEGNPVLSEADRPSCAQMPYGAVHLAHPPMIPLVVTAYGDWAECSAVFEYDSDGFVHGVGADCELVSPDGSEATPYAAASEAYENAVRRSLSRHRMPPSDPPFEGLRTETREIGFSWTTR